MNAEQSQVPASKNDRIALFRESVDKILNELDRKKGPGMAVWVEVDGDVIYSKWAGLAQREKRIAINGDTLFELASASNH